MRVAEVMTPDPIVIGPDETIERAAELMGRVDVGALPVCDGGRLVGLVTGRDLADRAASARCAPGRTPVSSVMTADVRWATTEDDPRADGQAPSHDPSSSAGAATSRKPTPRTDSDATGW